MIFLPFLHFDVLCTKYILLVSLQYIVNALCILYFVSAVGLDDLAQKSNNSDYPTGLNIHEHH